ncbi:hypothetical protein I7X12_07755 [Halosimplex litoreum]|uniref:Uncharacterized protein n=1 Tax=Halosimplex litoreum TaxID=1198301 RepID=A0A7T3G181_9EURY|nr:hypothetical protein [Halosimplex litoreum]QPV64495.1 hypothetical protein I7X12_07755 [Halosimplex litoreum]
MTVPWGKIATFGSLLTVLAVAPVLLGVGSMLSSVSIQSADIEGTYRMMNLAVGALKALVPLTIGGVILFAFFEFAGEMA